MAKNSPKSQLQTTNSMPNRAIIDVRHVSFDYVTPEKKLLFPKTPLSWRRVVYRNSTALDDVSMSVRPGRITTLLGRNGSGKTTLIKLITGSRLPKSGTVEVFGTTPSKARQRVGLCMGGSLIYHRLTARENLEYFGRLYGVQNLKQRIDELAELLALQPNLNQLVESFSFGMKVKLALARAMIHSPELLILDEPTLGIDLPLAIQLRHFVRELKCTVLLTTHYMEEADFLADDVCIIDRGKIQAMGTKAEVLKQYRAKNVPDAFTKAVAPECTQEAAA